MPRVLLRRAWAANRPLTVVGTAMVAVLVLAGIGLLVDDTVITGAPAWVKPAKFAASILVYSFTLLWMLTYVDGYRRTVRAISWLTTIALGLEMVLIAAAAALGTTSHFNVATPLHTAVWASMGSAIVLVWLADLGTGLLLLRQRRLDRAFAWSLRLGVLIGAAGMGVAFFMTSPTAAQLAAARSGAGLPVSGAHSVGVADGGPGLPVVGWSTVGGDLRVPHFLGLHGLQVLPLLGYLMLRFAPAWLRSGDRVALVWTAGLTYLGAVGLATWQALRGQSLVHPDGVTITATGIVLAAAAVATTVVLTRSRAARPALAPAAA